ncbi:MAG: glycosyl transferase family 2 [Sphingomonadales bacterium]|jgi:glycosyltransferase involved in cell wall biosynthesis|nr:glycosyl transferase family 2 [Sphingomonadales bacterium]
MQTPLKFSIVIANYNYGRFISRAIDSALGLDWPDVELIVVDDGSTDHSREVIEAYGGRIKSLFQPNAGQLVANNVGFAATHGDVIIFLDADDILLPDMARAIAAVWRPGVSKVQAQVQRIDENEGKMKSILPRLDGVPSATQIRKWAAKFNEYPSPPGSGNAYARSFLERIFPIDASRDSSTDTTCIAMAPFMGDVITIARPLVLYRMHDSNDSNLLASDTNFGREVERAVKRLSAAQDACEMMGVASPRRLALFRGPHLLQLRAVSLRLRPTDHPLTDDSRLAAVGDAIMMPFRSGFEPLYRRLIMAAYSGVILMAPLGIARALIRRRFARL